MQGSIAAIKTVPGLAWLIALSTLNNFIGGVFMARMDPYGLTLFSVEWWGAMLGMTSIGFMVGGIAVAKKGLGRNPLRTLLLTNILTSVIGMVFTIREWPWLFVACMFLYMCLIPIIESAEQTIIQRVVPFQRQGRVFGLAQAIESASSPISAFIIAPIAQFAFIPFMRSSDGKAMLGWLLGGGQARGIALAFVIAALSMLVITVIAFRSRFYRSLSKAYQDA